MSIRLESEIVASNKSSKLWGIASFTPEPLVAEHEGFTTDVIVVLDISSSMAVDGKLDNAKMAITRLISKLDERHTFAMVTFNHEVVFVIPFTRCTLQNKEMIVGHLNAIVPHGSTSVFSALKSAFKLLEKREFPSSLAALFMFSDGDNIFHHFSTEAKFAEVRKITSPRGCIFNVFGFGRDHDSSFLYSTAQHFQGNYHFVENAAQTTEIVDECWSVVSTTKVINLVLTIKCNDGCRLISWSTPFPVREKSVVKDYDFHIGAVSAGETKTVIFQLSLRKLDTNYATHPLMNIEASYVTPLGKKETLSTRVAVLRINSVPEAKMIPADVYSQIRRMNTIEALHQCINEPDKIDEVLRRAIEDVYGTEALKNILELCQRVISVRQHLICSLASSLFAERLVDFKLHFHRAPVSYTTYVSDV